MRTLSTRELVLGRENEVAALQDLVRHAGVITVLGPPGVGKSTLARTVLRTLAIPALVVDVASEDLEASLRRATPEPNAPFADVVAALCAHGRFLLVIDEAESAISAITELAPILLARPEITMLVTSRVRLRLRDEVLFDLQPLEADAARALFTTLASRTYRHTRSDDDAIHALVERLDRLPLAIELAAARTRTLSPREILARIDERFELLRMRVRDHAGRFNSLVDAIKFSLDALSPAERRALGLLTVFRGSFSAEAAEAVIGEPDAQDVLEALVDASVVHRPPGSELHGARFRLLDSIRAFELDAVDASTTADAELRHATYFATLGEELVVECERQDGVAALDRLSLECDEIEAAHGRMLSRDPELAAQLAICLSPLALARGPLDRHERRLDATLAAVGMTASPRIRLSLHLERGTARFVRARVDTAMPDLVTACSLTDAVGDVGLTDRARTTLMLASQWVGHVVAESTPSAPTTTRAPFVSFSAAVLALHRGDLMVAIEEAERGYANAQMLADRTQLARLTALCGLLEVERDSLARGHELLQRAAAMFVETRDANFAAIAQLWAALLALETDGPAVACRALEAVAATFAKLGMVLFEASANGYMSIACLQAGDYETAIARSDRALPTLRLVGDAYRLTNFLAARAVICIGLGRASESEQALRELQPYLERAANPNLPRVVAIYRALAGALAGEADATIVEKRSEVSSDVRLALATARALAPATMAAAPIPVLRVALDGSAVEVDGMAIDLRRRKPLARILAHLVARHRVEPGTPVATGELVSAGWPGERVLPASGAQRVWAAVATLRKLGLRDVLRRTADGYSIRADASLGD